MRHQTRSVVRLPAGVRDFLPRAAAHRRAIAERLLAEFEAWGYQRIITPIFECADVIERGLGDDARSAAIRFVEPASGEVVALRPDITPQVARIAATRMEDVEGPLRLCYEGAVTRLNGGARGQREILQAGIELIRAESPDGDVEAIAVAAAALAAIRPEGSDVSLDIGHVALARHALAAITDEAARRELHDQLLLKDRAAVKRTAARLDVPGAVRELITALPVLYGSPAHVLEQARNLSLPAPVTAAIDSVESVLEMVRDIVENELHASITVDLGEVRGFEYYTGIRFAGYVEGVGDAVLRGGRYDELVGRYGAAAHATGFAVDIEAAAHAHTQLPERSRDDSVLIVDTAGSATSRRAARRLAGGLRQAGHIAAVHLGEATDEPSLRDYAQHAGFARLLIVKEGGALCVDGDERRPVSAEALDRAAAGVPDELIAALRWARR